MTNREEKRDSKAKACGYRNWEHLIRATRNEPISDIAQMTGFSASTISNWRIKLKVDSIRGDLGSQLSTTRNPITEKDRLK